MFAMGNKKIEENLTLYASFYFISNKPRLYECEVLCTSTVMLNQKLK